MTFFPPQQVQADLNALRAGEDTANAEAARAAYLYNLITSIPTLGHPPMAGSVLQSVARGYGQPPTAFANTSGTLGSMAKPLETLDNLVQLSMELTKHFPQAITLDQVNFIPPAVVPPQAAPTAPQMVESVTVGLQGAPVYNPPGNAAPQPIGAPQTAPQQAYQPPAAPMAPPAAAAPTAQATAPAGIMPPDAPPQTGGKPRASRARGAKAAAQAAVTPGAALRSMEAVAAAAPTEFGKQEPYDGPGFELYMNCMPANGAATNLDAYVVMLAEALAKQYSVQDIRYTDDKSPLSYSKWKGALHTLAATNPPPPGVYYVNTAGNELAEIVALALLPICEVGARSFR